MSDSSLPFAFSQFVPGFDFLKNLSQGAAKSGAASAGGIPGLSNWVAPTLSVEEVDKRIQELKTVQYWLEQNGHALKATIQALEVQKMTLSTLRGMNLRMEDLAQSFARNAGAAAQMGASMVGMPSKSDKEVEGEIAEEAAGRGPHAASSGSDAKAGTPPSPQDAPSASGAADQPVNDAGAASGAASAGLVDPLQWWGALTQQFQQIAASPRAEAAQLRMPEMARPAEAQTSHSRTGNDAAAASPGATGRKKPAAKTSRTPTAAAGATAARKKSSGTARSKASAPSGGTAGRKSTGGSTRTRR